MPSNLPGPESARRAEQRSNPGNSARLPGLRYHARRSTMRKTLVTIAVLFVCTGALASAPPLSEAEKVACEIVADHLARGPKAVVDRLAATSPFSTVSPAEALAEITARLGPPDGAVWELRTSAAAFADHGAVFHVDFPSGAE